MMVVQYLLQVHYGNNSINEKHQTKGNYLPIVVSHDELIRTQADIIVIYDFKCVQVEDLEKR